MKNAALFLCLAICAISVGINTAVGKYWLALIYLIALGFCLKAMGDK